MGSGIDYSRGYIQGKFIQLLLGKDCNTFFLSISFGWLYLCGRQNMAIFPQLRFIAKLIIKMLHNSVNNNNLTFNEDQTK